MPNNLSADDLRKLLHYDPDTGVFIWRVQRGPRRAGDVAGRDCHGYRTLHLGRRSYMMHRLAWLYMTGYLPPIQIDHINLDKSDNRFCNLRLATKSENQANVRVRKDSTSGLKGVYLCKDIGRWQAYITVAGKRRSLGYFDAPERAHAAYQDAAKAAFGVFWRAA